MSGKLTEAGFAQRCAYMASRCAAWAGDSLTLPEYWQEPVKVAAVARFTDEIRDMLDRIDEQAGRRALSEGERG